MPKRRHLFSWILLVAPPLAGVGSQTPVTLDHEAHHHPVFANEWTRIFDVTVLPGDSTLYHVHPNDYVFVTFGDVALKSQLFGAEKADLKLSDGEVRITMAPITHRVVNPSTKPFHNLTIELLKSSGVALSAAPAGTTVLDNARVRVQRIVLKPGASTPRHEHRGPTLDVAVSAGSITTGSAAADRWTFAPASYRWNTAARTHAITNTGKSRVELVEIEWK